MKKLLIEIRKSKKLTRKELSDISGFKERTIASYERGEREPTKEYINFIESYFDINISDLNEVDKKFVSYYDTFDTSVEYALVKNKSSKIYSDNPLITLIFDENEHPDSGFLDMFLDKDVKVFDKLTLIKGLEYQKFIKFYMRHPRTILSYFDGWLKRTEITNSIVILQNNLFQNNYPLYGESYLGALWSITLTKEKVIFKPLSKNFNFNFNYVIEKIDMYESWISDEPLQIDLIKNEIKKEFEMLKNFELKMTHEEFKKLTIIGTAI